MLSEEFFDTHANNLEKKNYRGKKYLLKGIDPSGKGITCNTYASMDFVLTNNYRVTMEVLLVAGLATETWSSTTRATSHPMSLFSTREGTKMRPN